MNKELVRHCKHEANEAKGLLITMHTLLEADGEKREAAKLESIIIKLERWQNS